LHKEAATRAPDAMVAGARLSVSIANPAAALQSAMNALRSSGGMTSSMLSNRPPYRSSTNIQQT